MKLLLLLLVSFLSQAALADKDLGVGFSLGHPTGVTARKWTEAARSIDAAAGWSFGSDPHLIFQGAYVFHFKDALYFNDKHPLDVYIGAGGMIDFNDDIELGARLPLGLSYYFNNRDAEGFAEFSPTLELVPKTNFGAQLALGMRIYF
jgi:hypothetical protein